MRLGNEGEVRDYTESHFYPISDTSGRVAIYQNGELASGEVHQAEKKTTSTRGIRDAVGELNRCLSAAGIPTWIVAGASAACSAVGGWLGILSCYAAAGVASATVGYCAGSAARKL